MKDKNIAGVLALVFGVFGVHRFYLEQKGYGILYIILTVFTAFTVPAILSLIDALVFFTTDKESFDFKYNRRKGEQPGRYPHNRDFDRRDRDYRRGYRGENREMRQERRAPVQEIRNRPRREATPSPRRRESPQRVRPAANPFRQEGVQKFKDYDYYGAIEAFEKALEINPQDIAVHFNLACTYSLLEKGEKAFYHLDRAVAFGFKDFRRVQEHDALAWLRIQPEYDNFVENNYRLLPAGKEEKQPAEDLLDSTPDLLEQLKKLSELRKKGYLTEAEFTAQKRKLMG